MKDVAHAVFFKWEFVMKKWISYPKPNTYRLTIGLWRVEIKRHNKGWMASFDGHPLRVKGGLRSAVAFKEFKTLAAAKKAIIVVVKAELKTALAEAV